MLLAEGQIAGVRGAGTFVATDPPPIETRKPASSSPAPLYDLKVLRPASLVLGHAHMPASDIRAGIPPGQGWG